jgi:hypothetical protein
LAHRLAHVRFQATCVVCSPEFVKLFEELAPSLPALQYIIHFDKNQPSLSDGDSLPAQATLGTYPQQHQVSLSLPPPQSFVGGA